jgi:hypothetical protein
VTKRFAFEPDAREVYLALRKTPENALYEAVRTVLTELLADPGAKRLRQLRYRPDTWGTRVEAGDVRWLVLWRPAHHDPDVIEVHYIGPAPGES